MLYNKRYKPKKYKPINFFEEKEKTLHKFSNTKLRKKITYFLFLKLTLNNLFSYIYNFYHYKRISKRSVIKKKLNFIGTSLGITKYKGPAKNSPISIETSGLLLAQKCRKILKKKQFNLILFGRLNRKIKEFLKGFCKVGGMKIKRIILFSKLAHNGCRLKSKKRR